MPDLNDMATFVQVVEARSFSAAARRMRVSKSRVSKAVARLERALGARLLNRSTRRLSLTEAGTLFYRHGRRMVQEAANAAQAVAAHHAEAHGVLRVAASAAFGALRLVPALPALFERFPAVEVSLALYEAMPDLVAGGYDVAVVCAPAAPAALVARRIAPVQRVRCASPAYAGGAASPLTTDSELARWQAARAGLGVAELPAYLVEEDLRSGRLVEVREGAPPAPEQLFALRMPGTHVAPKVRVLIDFLCERFGPGSDLAGRDLRPLVQAPAAVVERLGEGHARLAPVLAEEGERALE